MTPSSSYLYFLISLTVLIRTYPSHSQYCYEPSGNFTPNSPYEKNRDAILISLSSNVVANDGFYNTSVGESPNTVYAIGFCRKDTSADLCGSYVSSAVKDLVVRCPNQKGAYSWGSADPPCFIRYSDTPIYGILQTHPTLRLFLVGNVTMNRAMWWNLTQGVVNEAVRGSSKRKYATGEANLSDYETIYSLLQCSPDLSPKDCESCLYEASDDHDKCCSGRAGGVVFKPSCIFGWNLYPFFAATASSSPPPPVPAAVGDIDKGTLHLSSWKSNIAWRDRGY